MKRAIASSSFAGIAKNTGPVSGKFELFWKFLQFLGFYMIVLSPS